MVQSVNLPCLHYDKNVHLEWNTVTMINTFNIYKLQKLRGAAFQYNDEFNRWYSLKIK